MFLEDRFCFHDTELDTGGRRIRESSENLSQKVCWQATALQNLSLRWENFRAQSVLYNVHIYIIQVCNVCSRHYDVAVKLDESQEVFGELLELVGNNNQGKETGVDVAKQKTFGEKLQRKYFSEITADEMEKLVRQFESDFLIFGYTFEQYKKALKST